MPGVILILLLLVLILQIQFRYASSQSTIILHENFGIIMDTIDLGFNLHNSIVKDPAVKTHALMIKEDIDSLVDLKQKMSLFKHGLQPNDRSKRHILTPLLSSLSGLASKRTTNQIQNMLRGIDLTVQKNHMIYGVLETNQNSLIKSINQSISAINNVEGKMINNLKAITATSLAISAANHFRKLTFNTLQHYEAIMRLPQNHLEIFNIVNSSKLNDIETAFSNHAEISKNIPPQTSLVSLFKEAFVEILITNKNNIIITYMIPLVEEDTYYISSFHKNSLILQTKTDNEIFTTTHILEIDHIRGNSITLLNRPIIYIRNSNDFKNDIISSTNSVLIHDVLLVSNNTLGTATINCENGTYSFNHPDSYILAIFIPHEFSLSSSKIKIKATTFKAKISIHQDLHLEKLASEAITITNLPHIHPQLSLMNLTKIPDSLRELHYLHGPDSSYYNWILTASVSATISAFPWLLLFIYGFCKNNGNNLTE